MSQTLNSKSVNMNTSPTNQLVLMSRLADQLRTMFIVGLLVLWLNVLKSGGAISTKPQREIFPYLILSVLFLLFWLYWERKNTHPALPKMSCIR